MKVICTKTGDQGMTSLRGGIRVPKDDIRIETNGQIDQLNALLGIVKLKLPKDCLHHETIAAIQRELMVIMSHVATPEGEDNPRILHVIELALAKADVSPRFVIPGNNETSSFLHLARTQARTAERRLWTLNAVYPVRDDILKFMNRLSDYLFLLAIENEQ